MSRLQFRIVSFGALPLMALCQPAPAAFETIPSTPIPPSPGEVRFSFPNSSLPNPGQTIL